MDIQILIYLAIGFAVTTFVAILFMIDRASDSFENWVSSTLGLSSGHGPLVIRVERNGPTLFLKLQNQGPTKMRLAAVEARDRNNQRHFPTPCPAEDDPEEILTQDQVLRRFSRIVLDPQSSQTVCLNISDLLAIGCSSLAIIDSNGKPWPVQQFNAVELQNKSPSPQSPVNGPYQGPDNPYPHTSAVD